MFIVIDEYMAPIEKLCVFYEDRNYFTGNRLIKSPWVNRQRQAQLGVDLTLRHPTVNMSMYIFLVNYYSEAKV
ncbi:hypothetical protein DD509_04195 [Dehalogenimonas alkenigignens]|nr:hypothetical protein DD509_04195 [Dehalogenimonas alkenigignens]